MKNKWKISKRGMTVGVVICFVAVIAWTGFRTFQRYQSHNPNQLAKVEEGSVANSKNVTNEDQESSKQKVKPNTDQKEEPKKETEETNGTVASADQVSFKESDTLAWPIEGKVLMNYNMEQTVYFATLDQYKYNPAMLVAGTVGMEVHSAASGYVTDIRVDAQTGTTITMDLGNGYQAVYGQMKDVSVWKGLYVAKGGFLGYLSEPTKYYSVEGCNLYFQMLKDGKPVDPMDYLES